MRFVSCSTRIFGSSKDAPRNARHCFITRFQHPSRYLNGFPPVVSDPASTMAPSKLVKSILSGKFCDSRSARTPSRNRNGSPRAFARWLGSRVTLNTSDSVASSQASCVSCPPCRDRDLGPDSPPGAVVFRGVMLILELLGVPVLRPSCEKGFDPVCGGDFGLVSA